MPTIWGYPLRAAVRADGRWVDVSQAFCFDPYSRSGIVKFDEEKVLDLLDEYARSLPAPHWAGLDAPLPEIPIRGERLTR